MKGQAYRVNIGGLYRCCVGNIVKDTNERTEGAMLDCPHCKDQVHLVSDGGSSLVWKRKPKEPS